MRAIILILMLLVSWSVCQAGDLKEIRNRTRELINENEAKTVKYWPDSVLNWRINDAQSFIVGISNVVQAETTYTLAAGTIKYTLPGDFYIREAAMFRKKVAVTSDLWEEPRYLPHRRKKDLGIGYTPNQEDVEFCSVWDDSIMFWPIPQADDFVVLYYIARPDTLASDGDVLQVPEPMEAIIPFFVASQCWYKTQKYTMANAAMEFFLTQLTAMTARYENALKSEYPVAQPATSPVTVTEP